jgi:predicted transcriptional regulator
MTLTLHLPPEIERRLKEVADQRGVSPDRYALQLLEEGLSVETDRAQVVSLVQSWLDEDDTGEQAETGDYLMHVLDKDRLSDRPLFPPELKGVRWQEINA